MLTFSLKTTLTVATRNKGCHDAKWLGLSASDTITAPQSTMALHVQYLMPYWNLRDLQSRYYAQSLYQIARNDVGRLLDRSCGSEDVQCMSARCAKHYLYNRHLTTLLGEARQHGNERRNWMPPNLSQTPSYAQKI